MHTASGECSSLACKQICLLQVSVHLYSAAYRQTVRQTDRQTDRQKVADPCAAGGGECLGLRQNHVTLFVEMNKSWQQQCCNGG